MKSKGETYCLITIKSSLRKAMCQFLTRYTKQAPKPLF
nr:MAG TPA: hypothetical protein [Caudoviricetes sp.]DAQ75007.1 MAG TPA: hypothetical protein [Caudoviricetes sp.]